MPQTIFFFVQLASKILRTIFGTSRSYNQRMQHIAFQKSSFIYHISTSVVGIAFFSIALTIIIFVVNEDDNVLHRNLDVI